MADNDVTKKVSNAVLYGDGTIKIENVRLSYPRLDKPYAGKGGDGNTGTPAYSLTGIMLKDTHRAAKDLVKEVMDGMMAEKKVKALPTDKKFLKDGDASGKEEYEGAFTFNCREASAPVLLDERGKIVQAVDATRKFYAGCYANVLVRPWFQDNQYGKRINANLMVVQFVKDGPQIGEGRISDEKAMGRFGAVADDDSGYSEDEEDEAI
jgi:hypothetical protein